METLAERWAALAAKCELDALTAIHNGDDDRACELGYCADLLVEMIRFRLWEVPGYE